MRRIVFKLCFEGNWYSVILLSQDGFESDYPENNFVKSVPKQPYADALHNKCFAKNWLQENTCVVVSFY